MSYTITSNILSKCGFSVEQLTEAEKALSPSNGYDSGFFQALIDCENKYDLNALFALAHADIESAHGNSYLAKNRNNLFGFNAIDSNPNEASSYASQADSVEFYANFLKTYYLTPGATYYNGDTPHGVFVRYSSSHDSEAQSVVGLMNELTDKIGGSPQQATPAPTITPSASPYVVKRGDTLWAIANTYGISLARLLQLNPQITNANLIFPGQAINVTGAPAQQIYIVRPNDNLSSIASFFHTTWQRLAAINNISNPDLIYPSQRLIIG